MAIALPLLAALTLLAGVLPAHGVSAPFGGEGAPPVPTAVEDLLCGALETEDPEAGGTSLDGGPLAAALALWLDAADAHVASREPDATPRSRTPERVRARGPPRGGRVATSD